MEVKVIGVGAAGNKAAGALIEANVIAKDNVMFINSTLKDVPIEYQGVTNKIGDKIGGCGKERALAQQFMFTALQTEVLQLDGFVGPETDLIVIVSSSEGGTGCGASSVLAEYIYEVMGIPVQMFVFTGFEEDARGLSNTVEYFQELKPQYSVQAISNKKFLDETGNKLRAEKEANKAFVNKIRTIAGIELVPCEQNIDETDLKKIVTTPGFMVVETANIGSKLKNTTMFNELCSHLIDNTTSLEFDPSAKRIGVILNISEKSKDFVDYTFNTFKSKLGSPFELYTHIQSESDTEFISVIAAGINLPIEDIKAVYDRYIEESNKVEKARDSFFNRAKEFARPEEDSIFDSAVRKPNKLITDSNAKRAFFQKMNKNSSFNISVMSNKQTAASIQQEDTIAASTITVLKEADIKNV